MAKKSKRAPRSGANKAKSKESQKPISAALKTTVQAAMAPTVLMASPKKNDQKTPVVNPNRGFQGFVTGVSQAAARFVPRVNRNGSPRKGSLAKGRPQLAKAVGLRHAKVGQPKLAKTSKFRGRMVFFLIILMSVGAGYYYLSSPSVEHQKVVKVAPQSERYQTPPSVNRSFKPAKVATGKKAAPKKVVTSKGSSLAVDSREFSKLSLKEKRKIWRKKSQQLRQTAEEKRRSPIHRVNGDH